MKFKENALHFYCQCWQSELLNEQQARFFNAKVFANQYHKIMNGENAPNGISF